MASTVARNKQDVDKMERAQRLYDSLDYSYTKKGEKISQEYDKSRSAADRAALGRGMQRSTQNLQTLANIDKQKLDALDDNYNTMIADYENRLTDLEEQDWQRDLQERQFAETQRQYDTSMAFQQAEADRAQQNTVWNQNFQQAEADRAQANTAWQQAFNERQYGDTQAYNTWNMAFQEKQAQLAADQWEKEYASTASTNNRQAALDNLHLIASLGNDASDELLAEAGVSRADFNAMKAAAAAATSSSGSSSGGSSGNSSKYSTLLGTLSDKLGNGTSTDKDFNDDLFGLGDTTGGNNQRNLISGYGGDINSNGLASYYINGLTNGNARNYSQIIDNQVNKAKSKK